MYWNIEPPRFVPAWV